MLLSSDKNKTHQVDIKIPFKYILQYPTISAYVTNENLWGSYCTIFTVL